VARHRALDLEAAIAGYRAILRVAPQLDFVVDNLCQALLGAGEYKEGFGLYDVRFRRRRNSVYRPDLPFPEWRGEPLAGRSIIVFPEQGFGDQIMFARFVRPLQEAGAEVTLAAAPELVRTFAPLGVKVIAYTEPFGRHDFWCLIGSLPGRLGVTRLAGTPYLKGGGGESGIGVAWRGRPTHANDANRSLPVELAERLLALPGAVNLDVGETGARDFEETAERIRSLACVVSVDTAIAHLAGAMGVPTLCLLPRIGIDWRWGAESESTPWYDSMTLARAGDDGWEPLLRDVVSGGWRRALDRRAS